MEQLNVDLGDRSYPIFFGADLGLNVAHSLSKWREDGRQIVLVADRAVALAHPAWLGEVFEDVPCLEVSGGERSKSLGVLGGVLDFFSEQHLDRRAVVVALGGGVIGDLAGFAGSIYLRGVDVVQIPTTLLAMVDSAVGGKTGINLAAGKNLVGTFHQPRAVFVNTGFLATLPQREFAAGVAEVIKYGLLGDAALFEDLAAQPLVSPADSRVSAIIRRCCAQKAAIVQGDERETRGGGGRALLNLGHTFGHALEQATGYTEFLHGEAVAIGTVCAARYSEAAGLLASGEAARVEAAFRAAGLPAAIDVSVSAAQLLEAMRQDKKARAGAIRLVIMHKLGEAALLDTADEGLILSVWREAGAS
ncbi:MAG TPA: 3-dehydroquinate synthase [Opitutaceae bacterium]|nr:3-dehydroquinate synthase [Opitutaceae bacterium]